ncbi:MAG: hypothetical protein ACOC9W_03345 [Persicimonas sp.]
MIFEALEGLIGPIIFFVLVGAIFLWHKTAAAERLEAAAEELGLRRVSGGLTSEGHLEGLYRDVNVKLTPFKVGSGKHARDFVRYEVRLGADAPAGLAMAPERDIDTLGKPFGLQDIRVGKPQLDRLLVIKGAQPDEVKGYLRRDGVAEAAVAFFDRYADARLADGAIDVERAGAIDPFQAAFILDALVDFVHILQGERQYTDPTADNPYADAHRVVEAELARGSSE